MKQRLLVLSFALLLLLSPLGAGANPLPYTTGGKGAEETFRLIFDQPKTSVPRSEFFKESERNLLLNEEQLQTLVSQGNVKVIPCNPCNLETAGLMDSKSVYWRNVKDGEAVVYLLVEGEWKPWFLISCGNPVRPIPLLTKREMERDVVPTLVPMPAPVVITPSGGDPSSCECCLQGPPQYQSRIFTAYVHEGFISGKTRMYTTRSSGVYIPTKCVTNNDY